MAQLIEVRRCIKELPERPLGAAMPSTTADSVQIEELRAELQLVLQSQSFARSPGLCRLLSYLCEKAFAGEAHQIKEYSVALDVLDARSHSTRIATQSYEFRLIACA